MRFLKIPAIESILKRAVPADGLNRGSCS